MIADSAPKTLATDRIATMSYVAEMAEKPFVDVNDFRNNRLLLEPHDILIKDARARSHRTSLSREGFIFARQKLPAVDYRDHRAIVEDYLPAMHRLITDISGADLVLMSDGPITRFSSPAVKDAVRPAGFAHTDYTAKSARDLLRISYDRNLEPAAGYEQASRLADQLSQDAIATRDFSRCIAIQTWRVLSEPPHDMPLALCAADSVSGDDIVEADFGASFSDFDENNLEFSLYRHSERHDWWYFADMEPDEVLIFVGYDFDSHARSRVLHSAFQDALCPANAVGRASVEARSFAFFKE